MPRSQLINQLQTGYGNRYTGEVIEGVRQKGAEMGAGASAGAGEKEETESEKETKTEKGTEKGTGEKKGAGEKKAAEGKEKPEVKDTKEKEKEGAGAGASAGAGDLAAGIEKPTAPAAGGEGGESESVEAGAAEGKEEEGKKEEKEEKGTGEKKEKEKKKKKKEPDKKGAKKEGPAAEEGAAEGPGGAAAFLLKAGEKAFKKVKRKIKRLGKHEKTHKSAKDKREESEKAVVRPEEEPQSRANQGQVEAVNMRTAPEAKDKEARSTLDTEVKKATPKKIKHVDSFKNDGKAQHIRKMVMVNVRGQTQQVQQTYQDIGDVPEQPKPPAAPPIPGPEAAPPTGAMKMGKELLPELPEEMTDLSHYENEADDMVAREGLDPEELAMVDSGPLAEANALRGQIKHKVQTAPGEIRQKEKDEKAFMEQELDADEKSSRTAMKVKRNNELGKVKETQDTKKKSEEEKRKTVTDEIQRIFREAKSTVTTKLENLETASLKQFDDGQKAAADKFEDTVKADMKAYKKSRYGGYFGWTKRAKDWALGMDDLPRVKEIFETARDTFVNEINALITTIIDNSQQVIADCKDTIQKARDEIAALVEPLEPGLKKEAEAAQKEFTDRLNALDKKVNARENELKEKLDQRRQIAIKKIDEKIAKMKEEMSGALAKAGRLLLQGALKMLKWALKAAGAPVEEILDFLRKAASAFWDIVKSPGAFLSNLIKALFGGFKQFRKNIVTHLKKGLADWLFGTMAGGEITMPEDFSAKSIFGLVMQVLRVTPAVIKQKIATQIGEENVERIEKVWGHISTFLRYGPGGLWEEIKIYFSDLKERVMGGIRDWVKKSIIIGAVEYIVSLFSPVSGIFKVAKMIYKVAKFIVQRIRRIIDVLKAIINSLSDIAAGAIGSAVDWIEKTLGRMVPVAIGFLAALLDMSGISAAIRGIIDRIRIPIHAALDKVIAKIAAKLAPIIAKVTAAGKVVVTKATAAKEAVVAKTKAAAGKVVNWWKTKMRFKTKSGERHTLKFDDRGGKKVLMVYSDPKDVFDYLKSPSVDQKDPRVKDATRLAAEIRTMTSAPMGSVGSRAINSKMRELSEILASLRSQSTVLPNAPVYKFTPVNGKAKTAEAELLSANRSGGTPPGSAFVKGWNAITQGLTKGGGHWVRMHLINQSFGGLGVTENLVPGPQSKNSQTESNFDGVLKDGYIGRRPNDRTGPSKVVWLKNEVTSYYSGDFPTNVAAPDVSAGDEPDSSGRRVSKSNYAEQVVFRAGEYEYERSTKKWNKNSAVKVTDTLNVPLPDWSLVSTPVFATASPSDLKSAYKRSHGVSDEDAGKIFTPHIIGLIKGPITATLAGGSGGVTTQITSRSKIEFGLNILINTPKRHEDTKEILRKLKTILPKMVDTNNLRF
jgi:hypothetical protein